jgi:archaeosine synthase
MRIPVTIDGTAFLGEGIVGPLTVDVPNLVWATPEGAALPTTGASIPERGSPTNKTIKQRTTLEAEGSGPSGAHPFLRRISLRQAAVSLSLELPVVTQETSGSKGWVKEVGEIGLAISWPLGEEERKALSGRKRGLAVWVNARALLSSPEVFVRAAIEVREAVGPSRVLWVPRVAIPSNLAFLHYLGIDLLDTIEGLFAAGQGSWLFPEMDLQEEDGAVAGAPPPAGTPCPCPSCQETQRSLSSRVVHANWQYGEEEEKVRFFIRQHRLRELVEARTVSHPALAEMLRYLDTNGYNYQETSSPVVSKSSRPYGIEEAYSRPEMERFRRNLIARYVPPPPKRILVLIPCSYTKPYASSPTHRAFARAYGTTRSPHAVHPVSVTSPLGVVPRELENFYPARNYDIPVTGRWSEEEKHWVTDGVNHLIQKGKYAKIVVHLSEDEFAWLKGVLPSSENTLWTAGTSGPASKTALASLESTVKQFPTFPVSYEKIRMEEAKASVAFQFSQEVAASLFEGMVRLRGPPWFLTLMGEDSSVLATWREDRGFWRLTTKGGAKVFQQAKDWWVTVEEGVTLKGDIFAPGVLAAGREVRVGGDVLLVKGGELVGVGESVVPGPWFGRLERGLAVRVRHRVGDQGSSDAARVGGEEEMNKDSLSPE